MPMFYFRGPRGPRRGGAFFLIIFLLAFLPEIIYAGLYMFIPIIMIGVFGIAVYKIVQAITSKPKETESTNTDNYKKNKSASNNYSNADLTRIDKKLEKYFKKNVELPIINDISLVTQNGTYQSVDSLFVTYQDEKVIKLGDFKDDYPEMFNKVISLLLEFSKKSDETIASKVQQEPKKEDILSDAQKYIDKINALNAAIPQEEITNGLYQTCDLLSKIEKSKQSNVDEQRLKKLYDYYLPILTGILENYKGLQDGAIKGEEFKKCEAQLIKTIMLINEALKTLHESMHEDDYLNINADINTLQSLLEKDGYGEDPFKTKVK